MKVEITRSPFGVITENGLQTKVDKFIMTGTLAGQSSPAVVATLSSFGANVVSLLVPDSNGTLEDVVLGFDTLSEYEQQDAYMGATIGRTASRVGDSAFTLNGTTYRLPRNLPDGHLHGGLRGFDKRVWTAEVSDCGVTFSYLSRHGEEGYPGDVLVQVTYSLTMMSASPALSLSYRGLSTSSTPLSMTHHSYFNLAGHGSGEAGLKAHDISINAEKKLVLEGGIATGGKAVLNPAPPHGPLPDVMQQMGGGIDDIFELPYADDGLVLAAKLSHAPSGRSLSVFTDQRAVVIYTSNYMPVAPGGIPGKGGALYRKHGSIALETSAFPNAVNVPSFPSVILKPGQVYKHECVYQFGA
ncbi:galactose mutarotase-like isoform X2 [Pollicipes pollicipes]|nr:galactose mutarotase-like isoform X2 [Pollicipes pollicipes]